MVMDQDWKLTGAAGETSKGNRRSQRERMLAGELYDASDPELGQLRVKAHELCRLFNASSEQERDLRSRLLDELVPIQSGR